MRRRVFIPALLTLAAAAAALLGACKANDTAGSLSAGAPKQGAKPGATAPPAATTTAPPAGTTVVHADGIRRVNAAELQKMVESGSVVIYDTRAKMQYEQEHIKGALSMPHDEVERRASEFPKDKTLAFYCT